MATTAVRIREERVVFIEIRISNTFIAYAGLICLSKPAEATAPFAGADWRLSQIQA